MRKTAGSITLVGAGPGDAQLLTLKAVRALESSDIVLYDSLVSAEVLSFISKEAQKIPVGKMGYGPSCRQDDINTMMVDFVRDGKRVVRLKGGDPLIFSRAGEEIAAARAAGIEVEIIPGITTAQAAAAVLGVPLTHRNHARRLQFVTGHDHKGELPTDIDWAALSDPAATTVVYMAKKTLSTLSLALVEHGLPSDTPAIAVMDATLPTQLIITGNVGSLPGKLSGMALEGPVIILIGQTLANYKPEKKS